MRPTPGEAAGYAAAPETLRSVVKHDARGHATPRPHAAHAVPHRYAIRAARARNGSLLDYEHHRIPLP